MSLPIRDDLKRLIIDIERNETISGCEEGRYRRHSGWSFPKGVHIESLGQSFCDAVDKLETGYVRSVSPYWIPLGQKIIAKLSANKYPSSHKIQLIIQQRLIALRRREGAESGTCLIESESVKIRRLAEGWKNQQIRLPVKEWEPIDEEVLEITAGDYPDFIRLLFQDNVLRSRFFSWAIRDRLSPQSFVKFPKTQELIEKLSLGPSIHMTGPENLAIKTTKLGAKCLTFPLYGKHKGEVGSKPVKFWNQDKVREFHHGFKADLKLVFDHLRRKDKNWVDFIVSARGFENWNVQHWGTLNSRGEIQKISLNDEWFRQVPLLEKKLTLEQAQERFGNKLNGENYAVALRASRRKLDRDVIGTHAFFDLCIPDEGGYIIVSPGKFSRVLPQSQWELIKIFGNSVPGIIVSHDPNVVYPWRQHTRHSKVSTEEKFMDFAKNLKDSIEDGRNGNLIFSIFADSCSGWGQDKMNDFQGTKENFFSIPIIDTEPRGLLKRLLGTIKFFPVCVQPFVTRLILMLFLPWRGQWVNSEGGHRWVSCYGCEAWNNVTIHVPSNLFHEQQVNGRFPRTDDHPS